MKNGLISFKKILNAVIQVVLTVSVIMIACILPLYFEKGFTTIGDDKHFFFRLVGLGTVYMAAVLLILRETVNLVLYFVFQEREKAEAWWKRKPRLSVPDFFLIAYAGAVLLSYLFSRFKGEALWGSKGWFTGTMTQLLFLGYYVLLSRVWKRVNWVWVLFVISSSVSFILGILNRFGIWPIDMRSKDPAFISTIGNMNWFCGWWSACIFLGAVLLLRIRKEWFSEKKNASVIYGLSSFAMIIYVSIGMGIGLIQGSDTGYLALFAGMMTLFILYVKNAEEMIRFWELVLLICGTAQGIRFLAFLFPGRLELLNIPYYVAVDGNLTLVLGIISIGLICYLRHQKKKGRYPMERFRELWIDLVFLMGVGLAALNVVALINTLRPGSIGPIPDIWVFTFNDAWGSSRGATLKAGVWTFRDQDFLHKLTGVGPDCMAAYIRSASSPVLHEFVETYFEGRRLTNAHCEWLTVLVDTGVLGLIGYAGAVISGIVRFFKNRRVHWFVEAAGICLLSYTVNNIFSFQTTINGSAIFLIWGIAEGILREKQDNP